MRNMLQILGGVAVAGVVAAGSTAFTGAGLNNEIVGDTTLLGGVVTQHVVGANLTAMTLNPVAADATKTKIESVELTFSAATPVSATVTITVTGTAGAASSTTPTGYACTAINGVSHKSLCTAGYGASSATPNGYFTNVTDVAITVA